MECWQENWDSRPYYTREVGLVVGCAEEVAGTAAVAVADDEEAGQTVVAIGAGEAVGTDLFGAEMEQKLVACLVLVTAGIVLLGQTAGFGSELVASWVLEAVGTELFAGSAVVAETGIVIGFGQTD